ncbi:MAG: hypothetical protein U0793_23790 [Gemmataceae bacterium]
MNRRFKVGPNELAGIPACFEETLPVRPEKRAPRKRKHPPVVLPAKKPTADDLAGIPVCFDDRDSPPKRKRRK